MKCLVGLLCCVFICAAHASTIAVTGGGTLTGLFSMSGDNFLAASGGPGVSHDFGYCALSAPCMIMTSTGIGPQGAESRAMFNGQPAEGVLSGVEGDLFVQGFIDIPANPQGGTFTGPVSVTGELTGVLIAPIVPFFEASVRGTGTASLLASEVISDCSSFGISGPCAFMKEPTFQFSGTADVTPISGSEVPEPSSLLPVAGALAIGMAEATRKRWVEYR